MKEVSFRVAVAELADSAYFRAIVAEIESRAPIVPAYDYRGATNIEEIKAKLAMRTHHELVMSIINPKGKADG